jgi:cbb3-type cytochrome oxidase subunit 3
MVVVAMAAHWSVQAAWEGQERVARRTGGRAIDFTSCSEHDRAAGSYLWFLLFFLLLLLMVLSWLVRKGKRRVGLADGEAAVLSQHSNRRGMNVNKEGGAATTTTM